MGLLDGTQPHQASSATAERRPSVAHILDIDPDLARDLSPDGARAARPVALAVMRTLEPGPWEPGDLGRSPGSLGLLVLDGLMTREVTVFNRRCAELLGKGDLLRPWDYDDGAEAPVPSTARWTVVEPSRLAVLDRRFAYAISPWPELTAALVGRAVRRSRALALGLAISHLPRISARLLVLLWTLADRWGRVEHEGVVLPLPLTHALLACLVGAQRPPVTTALTELAQLGLVVRRADRTWLLRGAPPEDPRAADAFEGVLRSATNGGPPVSEG